VSWSHGQRSARLRGVEPIATWMRRYPWTALAAGGAGLFFLSFVLVHFGPLAKGQISDTWLYMRYGDAIVHGGQVPYRDFSLEYPPGGLPMFVLPSLVEPFDYARSVQLEMLACGLAAVLAAAAALRAAGVPRRRAAPALAVIGLSPLLIGPLVLSRFDLWPAALTTIAVALLAAGRDRRGALVLGLAIAAKLYAAALLPLVAIDVWRRRGARAMLAACTTSIATAAAIFLPFAILAPSGVTEPITRQLHRPLQVESLGSAILIAVHQIDHTHIYTYGYLGSDNLASPGEGIARQATNVLGPLAVLLICAVYARGPALRSRFCTAAAATVTLLVAFDKVLSPQYMLWLVPLVPLAVTALRGRLALALLAVVLMLTQSWYPRHYVVMADRYHEPWTWLLLLRDVLLVVLGFVLATGLWLQASSPRLDGPGGSGLRLRRAVQASQIWNSAWIGNRPAPTPRSTS
jgi:Mannosyltransferase (PIG-M)